MSTLNSVVGYRSLLLAIIVAATATSMNTVYNYGPYDHVYPYVDITQNQSACVVSENKICPLYIALMMSSGGDVDSRGVIPAVQMAIDQINSEPNMLPGYSLHYILKTTKCETYGVAAMDALHTHLLRPPTKIGIIGSGCSQATEPTAEISHYYNLTHLSCVSSSPELSNRDRFKYHFQLRATEADLAIGFYSIIRHFKWRKVAIFIQQERLFEAPMTRLVNMLESSEDDIEIIVERFRAPMGVSELGEQPFDPEYRIFIFAMFQRYSRSLLCKAYEQNIQYPRNEFLFYGHYEEEWWKAEDEGLPCTAQQRQSVLGPALSPLQDEFISNCSHLADSGVDGFEFEERYEVVFNQSMGPPLSIISKHKSAPTCYDATWILARALNLTIRDIDDASDFGNRLKLYEAGKHIPNDVHFGLQHFSYNNSGVRDIIYDHLSKTHFNGITGEVSFNASNGVRRVQRSLVYQFRQVHYPECFSCQCQNIFNSDSIIGRDIVAVVHHDNLSLELIVDERTLWTDGIPYDGVPQINVESVNIMVTIIFSLLSTAGIVFAVSCMLFNFIFRDKKLIRLSSRNLNYMIGMGAIVLYIDVYLFIIPVDTKTATIVICNLTPWFTAIGYSLCYGIIIAKMFRTFYLFNNLYSKKHTLKDWMLGLLVAVFVSIDIVILVVYTVVEAVYGRLNAILMPNDEHAIILVGPTDIEIQNKFYICDSKSRDIALGVLYGYKAFLQVIALILSFSITNVKIKGLNDAKHITIAVYVTSIVTAVIIVALYSLKTYLNTYAILFSTGFLIGTTVILVLVFVPKMINLFRDPECKSVVITLNDEPAQGTLSMVTGDNSNSTRRDIIDTMQKKIDEQDSYIKTLQLQIDSHAACGDINITQPMEMEVSDDTKCVEVQSMH